MANEFIIKNGYRSQGNSEITGSLNVTAGITGSFQGTASFAVSASWAPGGGGVTAFPYTGSAFITGSLGITGSLSVLEAGVNSINSTTYLLRGSNGQSSIDWTNRILVNGSGATVANWRLNTLSDGAKDSVDWGGRKLLDTGGSTTSLDWANRVLKNNAGTITLDWQNSTFTGSMLGTASYATYAVSASWSPAGGGAAFPYTGSAQITGSLIITGSLKVKDRFDTINRLLLDTNGTSVDWSNRQLFDSSGTPILALDWRTRTLLDNATTSSLDWQNRVIYDSSNYSSIDWETRRAYDTTGLDVINWGTYSLIDTTAVSSVNWNNRLLYDASGNPSVDWFNRIVYDSSGYEIINWENKILTDSAGYARLNWNAYDSNNTIAQYGYKSDQISGTDQEDFSGTAITNASQNSAGEQIFVGTNIDAGAMLGDLVSLGDDGVWYQADQTSISSSNMIGITISAYNKGVVLTEGTITAVTASGIMNFPFIDGTTFYGKPVYMRPGVLGGLTTTLPTSGYIRVVGHLFYNNPTDPNIWLMKFRPSNDWYEI